MFLKLFLHIRKVKNCEIQMFRAQPKVQHSNSKKHFGRRVPILPPLHTHTPHHHLKSNFASRTHTKTFAVAMDGERVSGAAQRRRERRRCTAPSRP